jgi:hypothetical protein
MVDWTSGTNDANVAERDSGFVIVRIPGTPDVLKEAPVNGFVTKDANGNAGIGTSTPSLYGRFAVGPVGSSGSESAIATVAGSAGAFTSNLRLGVYAPNGALGCSISAIVNYAINTGTSLAFGTSPVGAAITDSPTTRLLIGPSGHFLAGTDNTQTLGGASNRWSVVFAGTGIINTSDERDKTDIGAIPEAWLDAWADVEWRRFKFVDRARWHIGLVAQQVHAAFAAHDIDAFEIGLCCFDAWEEESEPIFESVTKTRKTLTTQYVEAGVNENGQKFFIAQDVETDEEYEESVDTGNTKVTKPAGDRWGLRENECQAIEAAYKRRELSRMESRLALLEGAKS